LRIAAPSPGPSTITATSTLGHRFNASVATVRFCSEKISTLDSLLLTMKATSSGVRNELMQV
jgi:hypothetical protein